MADAEWKGTNLSGVLIEDVDADVVFDRWGIGSASLTYSTMWDGAPALVAARVVHPDFPWLFRDSATISREEAGYAKVKITFKGVPPETNEIHYRMSGSTSSEPIESHKDFIEKIGGTPASPLNNAQFESPKKDSGTAAPADRQFKYFPLQLSNNSPNPKAGIKSYLNGGVTYEQVWTYGLNYAHLASGLALQKLGKIEQPPTSGGYGPNILPVLPGRNWLLVSADNEQIGTGGKLTRKWRMSGPRGWDTDIYG